jgi:uncharacterized membrane protein YhaH (DUF805 family)
MGWRNRRVGIPIIDDTWDSGWSDRFTGFFNRQKIVYSSLEDCGVGILKAFFSFYGRLGIAECGIVLLGAVGLLVLGIVAVTHKIPLIAFPAIVACKWALLAALAKRFHDIGWSGAACLLSFVPVVGLITYFGVLLAEGTRAPNVYGEEQRFFLDTGTDPAPV